LGPDTNQSTLLRDPILHVRLGIKTKERRIMDKAKEFLKNLDLLPKPISEVEIFGMVKEFIKKEYGENPPDNLLEEQMAFAFIEDYPENKTEWGTYFGPLFVLPNEKGELYEYPSLRRITPQIIYYWQDRAKEAKHPILKARYSNLVWDLSEKITGKKPHYSIAQVFIDCVIETAQNDLHKFPTDTIKKLERALSLALTINDKERIEKIKDAIIYYENKIAEDGKAGLWGFSYELLLKNNKIPVSEDEERNIINSLGRRFERLLKSEDIWAAEKATFLLVDYYRRIGNQEEAKQILLTYGNMVQQKANQVSALQGSGWLEKLYHIYLQHGLKEQADKISTKLKELWSKSSSELKTIEARSTIPKEKVDKLITMLIEGDLKAAFAKVAVYYIPRKDEVKKQLDELSKIAPLIYLITHKIQDHEGRVISTVGPLEEDLEGHIALQVSQNMNIESFFLRETIKALVKKFNFDAATIVNYLYESPIFEEKRRKFFIKGLEAYLNGDFLVALHILISQIEALARNLAEKTGTDVLKPSRLGGFNYKTLDDLLREENIIKVLGEDMCLYLRVLLCDPRGWNLRNDICHGLIDIEALNQMTADRVFHALLCLSLVKQEQDAI